MAVSAALIKSSAELGAGVATLAFASSGLPFLAGLAATGVALAGLGGELFCQKSVPFGPALKQRIAQQCKSLFEDLPDDADWVIALKLNLPKLTLTPEAAARFSTQDGGYAANATQALLERLAQTNPLFADPTQDTRGQADARNAAEMIIGAGVQAAFTDRHAFEALEPALITTALETLGNIDRKIDRVGEQVDAIPEQTVSVLLAEMQRQGLVGADGGRGQISSSMVKILARRLDDFQGDLDQQIRELIRRLDAAESLIEEGQHPGNVDVFLREVQRRVAQLTQDNKLDAAGQAFEDGLAEFRRQKAERDEADIRNELALLHTGILMATASGNVEDGLNYELQRLELDAKRAEPELSLHQTWKSYHERAERFLTLFDLQVCLGLAEHGTDQGPSNQQAGFWWHALGMSKALLGEMRGDDTLLEDAITAYKAALTERTQDRAPMQWGSTQNNLGTVLQTLGQQRGDDTLLEDAITAYKAALTELKQDRAPMDWASTQNNLGTVLNNLGQQRGDDTLLEDAITAYKAALTERTQDRAPMQWAMTCGNLGKTLSHMGALKQDPETIERGIAKIETALSVFSAAGARGYAQVFNTMLESAREKLAAVKSHKS